jgi:hypothetical protein
MSSPPLAKNHRGRGEIQPLFYHLRRTLDHVFMGADREGYHVARGDRGERYCIT